MENLTNSNKLLQYKQLYVQFNIVYLSTFISSIIFEFVFYFMKADIALLTNTFVLFLSVFPIILNRKEKYGLASLIFLSMMGLSAFVNGIVFGIQVGFGFYFFNFAGLIIYTNWKSIYKLLALLIDVSLLLLLTIYFISNAPLYVLSNTQFYAFLVLNIVLNITGIAHSAYFYMNNAKSANDRLSYLSTTDLLTGLMNRSAFIESFMQFCQNQDQNIGLIMFDIDFFKTINDTYGHLCGDEVLSKIGALLKDKLSDKSLIGRYGGEEFILVFNSNSLEDVQVLAEEIRELIQMTDFNYENQLIKTSISIGAVFYPLDVNHGIDIDRLLAQADQHLYVSKQNGRNRVSVSVFKLV